MNEKKNLPRRKKTAPTAADMRAHIQELKLSLTKLSRLLDEQEKITADKQDTIEQLKESIRELVGSRARKEETIRSLREGAAIADVRAQRLVSQQEAAQKELEQAHCVLDSIRGVAPRQASSTEGSGGTTLGLTARLATGILALLTLEDAE